MGNSIDVLVVGAGPTGIVATNELLRRGVKVRWVDSRPGPAGTTRAFTVHARTFEAFEHIGIAHKITEVNAFCPGNRFHIEGMNIAEEDMPVLDFRKLENTRYNFYGKVNQQDLEQILRNHVANQHSVSPDWNVTCTNLKQDESGIEVTLEHENGDTETVNPRYVIGADGVHSIVRKCSDLEMRGDAYTDTESGDDGYFTMSMMDVPLEGYSGDDDWINYHFSGDDWMLVTRLPDGNHRVYISGELEKKMQEAEDHSSVFQEGLDRFAPGTRLMRKQQGTTWKIYRMIADDYSKGNVFLCGDACHVRSPAGGQGANCCMMDAFNLGWKLASVIKGGSPDTILKTYGIERKPVAEVVQGFAERQHNVLFDHTRTLEERIQDTKNPVWQEECINGISGLSHNYCDNLWQPEGLQALADDSPKPGLRAPNALISDTPKLWMHDIYRHTRATLLMLPRTEADQQRCRDLVDQIEQNYSNSVKCAVVARKRIEDISIDNSFVQTLDDLDHWYGKSDQGRLFLIRPDLYVGYASQLDEHVLLQEYLDHWYLKNAG